MPDSRFEGYLADGLRGIRVKNDTALMAKLTDLLDRVQRPDLVIGRHHGDQDRAIGERSAMTFGEIHPCSSQGTIVTSHPSRASRLMGSRTALCSEAAVTRCLPRRVAACATPLMAMLFDSVAPEVKMISRGVRSQGRGDLFAGAVDGLGRLPAESMRGARRISIQLSEIRQHGFDHAGIGAGGCVVIEVNRFVPHAKPPRPCVSWCSRHTPCAVAIRTRKVQPGIPCRSPM